MRFILLDRVTDLVVGERISAVKALSLAEEYLADHFPKFPVLPGVLMIESLVQTAAMLVRVTNHFEQSMVVLQEARNIKYKSFVKPGNVMAIMVEAKKIEAETSSFVGQAEIDGQVMVQAKFKLKHYNLADKEKRLAQADAKIIQEMKDRALLIGAC